jgi:hypothetical protein
MSQRQGRNRMIEEFLKTVSKRWWNASLADELSTDLKTAADAIDRIETEKLHLDEEPVPLTPHLQQLAQEKKKVPRRS